MISKIIIPNLGATGGAVTFEEWRIAPGDYVETGSPIFVVTTDKATVEVEAFKSGYLRKTFAKGGDQFAPGDVVGLLSESLAEDVAETGEALESETPEDGRGSTEPSLDLVPVEEPIVKSRRLASPLARRMAVEAGVDLSEVSGSGRRGEILRRDIERTLEMSKLSEVGTPLPRPVKQKDHVPLSDMRRAIADRTLASKTQIPHFYATITIDMEAARTFLESATRYAQKQGWQAPTLTDLILRAAALTLRDHPQINATFDGDAILYHQDINIGLVIGLDEGLIVPVVHRADEMNLYTIAARTRKLKDGAGKRALRGSDLSGSTFTLSNLGMYGLDSFIAVINPPEAGVLAVGAVRQVPAVREDQMVPRWQMEVVLSVDHRIVDGVVAARYLSSLKELLEEPVSLALDAPQEGI